MMAFAACRGSSYGGSTPAATTTTASGSSAAVKTATATVKGKAETILTNAQGKTLYHFTSDTATTSACTGTCTQTWHPLLVTSGAPTSATTLPGKLSAQTTANGNQVEYNGHLLYTYAGDSGPGQTNGEGLFGKWFVTTPNLK
jgi:predicted lipoprotein with Yx(FWY)xxD motif